MCPVAAMKAQSRGKGRRDSIERINVWPRSCLDHFDHGLCNRRIEPSNDRAWYDLRTPKIPRRYFPRKSRFYLVDRGQRPRSDRREFMGRIDVLERREGDADKTWSSLDRTRFHVPSFVRSGKSGTIDLIARSRQNRVGWLADHRA